MKTILRIVYILAAAGIVFAGLYWYGSVKAKTEPAGQPVYSEHRGEGQGAGKGTEQGRNQAAINGNKEPSPDEGGFHMGGAHELIDADVEILILIRNLAWVAGAIILVLLLQSGWNRLRRRKPKTRAGSA